MSITRWTSICFCLVFSVLAWSGLGHAQNAILATPTPVTQLPGDTCATAYTITLPSWTTQYDDATLTNGTPAGDDPCQAMGMTYMARDGWFRFDTTFPGTINLHFEDAPVAPGKDIILIVYTGADCANLTEVQCLSAFYSPYLITWSHFSPGGETYWVQVGDWGSYAPSGQLIFAFNFDVSSTPTPTNTPTPAGPGDHCGNPEVISVGQCVTGSTVGYNGDYDCSTGSSHYGSDRVYALTLTESEELDIFAEADWNADFAISSTCSTTSADILCTDSTGIQQNPPCSSITHHSFGYFSWSGIMAAGTYYIWIDSASGANGNYALAVLGQPTPTPTQTPCVTCPPGGVPEGEPMCGPEYQDNYNGGCNWPDTSPTPGYHFQSVNCGDILCGEAGYYDYGTSEARDMDWYRISVPDTTYLGLSVTSAFDTAAWIMDGASDCASPVVLASRSSAECQEVSIGTVVSPGAYWLVIAPHTTDDPPCGTDYVAYVSCGASPTPTQTPDCSYVEEFGSAFPPEGWTIESAGAGTQWASNSTIVYSGTHSAYCPFIDADHDEWLITRPINLTTYTNPEIRFYWTTSYYWMVSPIDNGDFIFNVSTDGGMTWTPLWDEEDEGMFSSWYWYEARVDLSAYSNEASIRFAWQYVGNDATDVYLDLVRLCNQPSGPQVPVTGHTGLIMMVIGISALILLANFRNR